MNIVSLDSAGSSPRTRRGSAATRRQGNGMASRTLPSPVSGYGSTHRTSLAGLGLGIAESRRATEDALSSPRRISTSNHNHPPYHRSSQSPSGTLNLPTHEAYYTHSQPSSAHTPHFRGETRHAYSQTHTADHANTSLPSLSTGHRRLISLVSNADSTRDAARSPTNSLMKRLRHRASIVGLHLGGQTEYDADLSGRTGDEEIDESQPTPNGTRVWYR